MMLIPFIDAAVFAERITGGYGSSYITYMVRYMYVIISQSQPP
jgi:hypothetical protein